MIAAAVVGASSSPELLTRELICCSDRLAPRFLPTFLLATASACQELIRSPFHVVLDHAPSPFLVIPTCSVPSKVCDCGAGQTALLLAKLPQSDKPTKHSRISLYQLTSSDFESGSPTTILGIPREQETKSETHPKHPETTPPHDPPYRTAHRLTETMPTTTEILVCPLKPGSDIGSESNAAAQILKEVGATLKKTDGVQQIQFGMQVEKPDVFQLLVHWDSVDHHQAFMATEEYKPFLNRFLGIVGGDLSLIHANLEPSGELHKAISAPVTEVATFYFGSDGAPEGYLEGVEKFKKIMEQEKSDGYIAGAIGLTVEENVKSPTKEDVEGKAAVLIIGWESVEKHMQFRETATFKDNIHYLRNGAKDVEMHHVAFLNFVE